MAIDLDHPFTTAKPIDESFAAITDLERVVPAVEGGSVTETISPEKVKAEILMRMGAMSMKLIGTVEVVEQDAAGHTALVRVRAKESGAPGTPTPMSPSSSTTAAARSTRTRRSPARPRRWARAW
jgi:carbon monoxide dehydrogenase subunit G